MGFRIMNYELRMMNYLNFKQINDKKLLKNEPKFGISHSERSEESSPTLKYRRYFWILHFVQNDFCRCFDKRLTNNEQPATGNRQPTTDNRQPTTEHRTSKLINLIIFLIIPLAFGCKSMDLPSVDNSEKKIKFCQSQLDMTERAIETRKGSQPTGNEVIANIKIEALNKILDMIASNRNDDINITFPPTRSFMNEEKSALGIKYTNQLNIDSGFVSLNLKKFYFEKFDKNQLFARIELEGKGYLKVSGKYTGIPASASPEIELYMNEPVAFDLVSSSPGTITLKPKAKKLILKTKFYIKLLEWKIPWNQDIPLELTDMIKPMTMPVAMQSEIQFPLPAKNFGKDNLEYVPYVLDFVNSKISANSNAVDFRTNINFRRK